MNRDRKKEGGLKIQKDKEKREKECDRGKAKES